MSGVLRAEIRKITTTRLWWILLICVLVLGAAYAAYPAYDALVAGRANDVLPPFGNAGIVRSVYNGGNTVTRVLAMVLGMVAVASEYRYHTLGSSYLASPRRLRLLLAKALACAIFGALYGVVSVAAGMIIAAGFVSGRSGSFFLGSGVTWRSLALHVLSLALWAVLGVGVGALIKNLLVAVAVGVGFAFVLEPLASWLFLRQGSDRALNLFPTGATNAMLGNTSPVLFAPVHPYPWATALLVLAGWCLVPAVIGVLTTTRRDVS